MLVDECAIQINVNIFIYRTKVQINKRALLQFRKNLKGLSLPSKPSIARKALTFPPMVARQVTALCPLTIIEGICKPLF